MTSHAAWLGTDHWKSERWKTAIYRGEKLSRPIKSAIASGILNPETSLLDYGCGRGHDMANLKQLGYEVQGFDPWFAPVEGDIATTDVVSLGFVLNVIEHESERPTVLKHAYDLAKKALIVGVRCDGKGEGFTSANTFQKYWTTHEIEGFIKTTLPNARISVLAEGICLVERSPKLYLVKGGGYASMPAKQRKPSGSKGVPSEQLPLWKAA